MSGQGIKKWSTGDVLTASDLNGYVGEQIIAVFGTVAARTAAYGGSGEPILSEGMFSYVIDSDGSGNPAFQYYDGGSWVDVVTAIGPGSITESMLATGAVTASKIADGTIVAAEIANDAVTTDKILDGAVTSAKIADATIVNADISASAAISYSKLNLSGSITSSDIVDETIVNQDISSTAAIDIDKLADATIDTKTANYTLVLEDKNKIIEMNLSSANTLTIPTNASVAFPVGSQVSVIQYGTGKTFVTGSSGVNVRGTPGTYLRAQYSSAVLIKRATDEWYILGDVVAS